MPWRPADPRVRLSALNQKHNLVFAYTLEQYIEVNSQLVISKHSPGLSCSRIYENILFWLSMISDRVDEILARILLVRYVVFRVLSFWE